MSDFDEALPQGLMNKVQEYLCVQAERRGGQPTPRTLAVATSPTELATPPFPEVGNPMMSFLVLSAERQLETGLPVRNVLVHLAAHSWMEGHVEGFDHGYAHPER